MQPVSPQVIHIKIPSPNTISAGTNGMGNVVKNLFHLELAKVSASQSQTETASSNAQVNNSAVRAGVFMPASAGSVSVSGSQNNNSQKSQKKMSKRKSPVNSTRK